MEVRLIELVVCCSTHEQALSVLRWELRLFPSCYGSALFRLQSAGGEAIDVTFLSDRYPCFCDIGLAHNIKYPLPSSLTLSLFSPPPLFAELRDECGSVIQAYTEGMKAIYAHNNFAAEASQSVAV